jgi:hypothetical protein
MERVEKLGGNASDVVNCLIECGLICGGWLSHATELADELQRRRSDFIVGGGRFEVEERFDAAAHVSGNSGRVVAMMCPYSAWRVSAMYV